MTTTETPRCRVVDAGDMAEGKQRAQLFEGVAAGTVGSRGLCMHLVTIPPGAAGDAHRHDAHETALFVLEGEADTWFGPDLAECVTVRAGQFLYIPANVPHRPVNRSTERPVRAVLARTDPNEQESVVLLPHLDHAHPAGPA
ncbi:cupin domain-containing protein [Actinomycetospora termitidis]|uniref:Cupin domain-containing protein n=1 Tax=Actinomycetospora termitidis TaxID=3053470 RepID=A0ABT7MIJ5_9PSEU|nr:cupin domain-containing protein [Actinomycetospora sp. Odt1-22]MDL5159777.1 cupin domain-containing protein [Actinomycetospora sp. Odt1-22]